MTAANPALPFTSSVPAPAAQLVGQLRALAVRALPRMYIPERRLFAFRLRKQGDGVVQEGVSLRYTATVLIGLAEESPGTVARVLGGETLERVGQQLATELAGEGDPGAVALSLWGFVATSHPGRETARRRLEELLRVPAPMPTVELAWAVTALSLPDAPAMPGLRDDLAARLMGSFDPHTGIFAHVTGGGGGLRSHVSCFADLVYPIYALSKYHAATGDGQALEAAKRCAERTCALQGEDGQWWWHYDVRTGSVVETYPVYSVHQDSMAPMALLALAEVGPAHLDPIWRGLEWLERSPELAGGSLIDRAADLVWRKVARREPNRTARVVQALASRAHPRLRVPALDTLLPPGSIDFEDRPYHMAWILHAFPPRWERALAARPEAG